MKNIILALVAALFAQTSNAAVQSVYDRHQRLDFRTELLNVTSSQKTDPAPINGGDLLKSLKFDQGLATLEADWTPGPTSCGDEGYFFLTVRATGTVEGQEQNIEIAVQTLNTANLRRIYDAISANLPSKGFPDCLLKDMFMSQPMESFIPYHRFIFQPVPKMLCTVGEATYGYPVTSCINEKNLYP